jgi:pyrroloquinoline quinone biosynthesis protein D
MVPMGRWALDIEPADWPSYGPVRLEQQVDSNFKPKRRDDIRSEDVANEAVLYDPTRGQAVYLNDTAAIVWKLCDGTRTVAEMTELLAKELGDPDGRIAPDVAAAVETFAEAKLVS